MPIWTARTQFVLIEPSIAPPMSKSPTLADLSASGKGSAAPDLSGRTTAVVL